MKIKIFKEFTAVIKADKETRTITATVSTGEKDRSGEYIPPAEWKLANYEKNPVILWAHDYSTPPVGKALWTKIEKSGLIQKIQFAKTAFAQDIFDLYEGGFLNAFSVGFMSDRDSEDSTIFRNCELLEVSCVPVPCNAGALAERAASGLIKSPEALAFVKTITDNIAKETIPEGTGDDKIEASKTFLSAIMQELKDLKKENEDLKAQIPAVKEGRVLSTKNRALVAAAHAALKELLDATDPTEEAAPVVAHRTIDKAGKFVIMTVNKKDAPKAAGISAGKISEMVKGMDISGIVRREISKAKGEVE
jgi:uncharacterized protein